MQTPAYDTGRGRFGSLLARVRERFHASRRPTTSAARDARRAILGSGLFDRDYYLARYPEAGRSHRDPLDHYLEVGSLAGANPNPMFDGDYYLESHPELRRLGVNPLLHYLRQGARDGSPPHPFFDPAAYVRRFPEARADSTTPLRHYLDRRKARRRGSPGAPFRVRYVSGLTGYAAHGYRVLHHVAALRELHVDADVCRLEHVAASTDDVADVDVIVLYRIAWSDEIERLVGAARSLGARVVYDTDDYVFDPEVANARHVDGLRFLTPDQLPEYARGIELYRRALLAADAAILSTQTLADAVARLGRPAFVLRNGFDRGMLELSTALRTRPREPGPLRIGYASGTMTHQKDFGVAATALTRILARYEDVALSVVGNLDVREFPGLGAYAERIEHLPLVPHEELPRSLARFDVNLAPLEVGNPYCEAKSNLKYFEAALLEIPTVASATQPFAEAIRSGENGFLATSDAEWEESLAALVEDPALRSAMGRRARAHAEATYGPAAKVAAVRDVFLELSA